MVTRLLRTRRIDTATEVNSRMSIKLGHLYVPALKAPDIVVRHCHPLLVENDDKSYPLTVAGSSVLLRYRRQLVQLMCAHQLENTGRDPSEIRLADSASTPMVVPPVTAHTLEDQIPELANMQDLVAATYELSDFPALASHFLLMTDDQFTSALPPYIKRSFAYFFVGFPRQAIGYDLSPEEDRLAHLRSKWIKVHVEPIEKEYQAIPNRQHYRCLDPLDEMGIEPDGISGSPVFHIYQTRDDQCRIGFCGLITHANDKGVCAVYESEQILRFLKNFRH